MRFPGFEKGREILYKILLIGVGAEKCGAHQRDKKVGLNDGNKLLYL